MPWQLRDPEFQRAIHQVVNALAGRGALVGAVGVQVHLAAAVGLEKLGPPARAIELVTFPDPPTADRVSGVSVVRVDAMGFDASIERAIRVFEIEGKSYPAAAPEHILGLLLAAPEIPVDAKWACFALMRTYAGRIDLEEARGFIKRGASSERHSLLAELAYLAA